MKEQHRRAVPGSAAQIGDAQKRSIAEARLFYGRLPMGTTVQRPPNPAQPGLFLLAMSRLDPAREPTAASLVRNPTAEPRHA
jgi:hypothetical protein